MAQGLLKKKIGFHNVQQGNKLSSFDQSRADRIDDADLKNIAVLSVCRATFCFSFFGGCFFRTCSCLFCAGLLNSFWLSCLYLFVLV